MDFLVGLVFGAFFTWMVIKSINMLNEKKDATPKSSGGGGGSLVGDNTDGKTDLDRDSNDFPQLQ
jgi:hypothetical protein